MPDTRVTGLTRIEGAGLSLADKFVVVDVSDTTMAATGTDKAITTSELKQGVKSYATRLFARRNFG